MIKTSLIPPPPKRAYRPRVTPMMRAMKPGESFATDPQTAAAFTNFARYHGWEVCQRKENGSVRVWRVA